MSRLDQGKSNTMNPISNSSRELLGIILLSPRTTKHDLISTQKLVKSSHKMDKEDKIDNKIKRKKIKEA